MNSKILKLCVFCLMILFMTQTVHADVYTVDKPSGENNCVYIKGNPNMSPVEYYNKETKQFEGVIPKILSDISKNIGLDFVYVRDYINYKQDEIENTECQIISSYLTNSDKPYVKDGVTLFAYNQKGKEVDIGLAFTENAEETLISVLKSEVLKITPKEINGYLIAAGKANNKHEIFSYIYILCCMVLSVMLFIILVKLKKTKIQMNEYKMTDLETGIGNLAYFEHCYNEKITEDIRNQYQIIYIIIDSNYLKFHHGEVSFTDAVKYTANVLKSFENADDISARITETGFVFAFYEPVENKSKERIENIIKKLNLYLNQEHTAEGTFFHAAVYRLDALDKNCEFVLYNLRRNCNKLNGQQTQLVVCDKYLMNSAIEERKFLEKIVTGLDEKEFKLYLQFIVDSKTKKIVAAEALSRWESKESGIIPPVKYIALMESYGLISRLDYYMFELVCRQLHKWRDTEKGDFWISCNFTRITISENDFVSKIKEISDKYVFDKSQLVIEITEDAIEKNYNKAMQNILKCKELGFKIALDDMGNGNTSLINLCDYPIDIVKIDRDVLLKAEKNRKDLFIGIISLAHSMGLRVVCEGVETTEQNVLVEETNCNYIQGWFYSRVYPDHQADKFMTEYNCKYTDI